MSDPRAKLLARVIDHYAEHGVRDTSLRSLAARIGTSQRMLHHHFGSRTDLLVAVVEAMVDHDTVALRELFADEADPMTAGRRNWQLVADRARTYGALYFELSSHAMYALPHAERLGTVLVTRTETAFADAYETVTGDRAEAVRLARLTVAVGRGLMYEMLIDGDRAASDDAVELFVELVRNHLGQVT
ncbi:TetR family transcriptional regulator [Microlunatus sp. Y2014]|uniref:TetR family transcriptional regulator n=1 Tax=Microlunatus sp. Y2014 TaxID=3418488 RepID=UPI003DA79DD2